MKPTRQYRLSLAGLALALALSVGTQLAHANVYATNIKINSTLTGTASVAQGAGATISYVLNDAATGGVTIKILSGSTAVRTINIASPNAGTTLGLNSVIWDGNNNSSQPVGPGNYTVQVTAGATGYSSWQQISPLDNNHVAVFPLGMAVDKNVSSPYYGRVVVGCATVATQHGVAQQGGFYKYNADGSPADEGSYGYANYTSNDSGATAVGQMQPVAQSDLTGGHPGGMYFQINQPSAIRIGEDDRIYWSDNSAGGSIQVCDILASQFQSTVLPRSGYANNPGFNSGNYNNNGYGWISFDIIHSDVASSYTGNNGIYTGGQSAILVSDWGDYPNVGPWVWHLVGTPGSMVADPTDTYGTQVAQASSGATLNLRCDGIQLDYNFDFFGEQDRGNAGDPAIRGAAWLNWNGGVLPPGNQGGAQGGLGGSGYALVNNPAWTEGGGSSTDLGGIEWILNSKTKPTLLAKLYFEGASAPGVALFNPFNPIITITNVSLNGTTLSVACTALYGPNGNRYASPYAPLASQLTLYGATAAAGPYAPVTATFSGANGVFSASTTVSTPAGFFKVGCPTIGGTVVSGQAVTIKGGGPVTSTLDSIDVGRYRWALDFDGVGNLYAGSPEDNYWRAWSPPGANQNTTTAVVGLSIH